DEDHLAAADGAHDALGGASHVTQRGGRVEVLETRAEVALCALGIGESARNEQPAKQRRQVQLATQRRDGVGVRSFGEEPARLRPYSRCGHAPQARSETTGEQSLYSAKYSKTPHASQSSVAPVAAIVLRRCIGIAVSQCAHDSPRSGKTD